MKIPPGTIEVFLQPGDFYFGGEDTRIRTLLGSCISITVWHPLRRIGGMCHFMLPSRPKRTEQLQGKYADEALELFESYAARFKTLLCEYEIKLIGGGQMFPSNTARPHLNVSEKNIDAVEALLRQRDLHPTSRDLGGVGHRSVFFEIWSGHVWVRHQPLVELRKKQ